MSLRIVHVANFYGPRSGGLRTTMHALGAGYEAAGHEMVMVVPGPADADERTPSGRRITLAAPVVPGTGGYRVITHVDRVRRVLAELGPDRLEVLVHHRHQCGASGEVPDGQDGEHRQHPPPDVLEVLQRALRAQVTAAQVGGVEEAASAARGNRLDHAPSVPPRAAPLQPCGTVGP